MVLGVPTLFPDLNLVQPDAAVRFLVIVFEYWATLALGRLLYLLLRPALIAEFDPPFESESELLRNKEMGTCPA